jgi:hypothetical protein
MTGLAGPLSPSATSSTPVVRRCSGRAPPGAGCGVDRRAFNRREPLFNRRSPPLLPQAGAHRSPCRPPPRGDLSATVLALTQPLGWCTPRPPRSPWSGRARQRCARRRPGRWCSARGCQRPGGEQPTRPSPGCSAEGCSCRQFGIQPAGIPRLASMPGLRRRVRTLTPQPRCGDQLGATLSSSNQPSRRSGWACWPPRSRPAAGCARPGCRSARRPLPRDLSTVDHASFALGPRRRAGDGVQPGSTVVQAGWMKDPAGQRSQAIGARGSGV